MSPCDALTTDVPACTRVLFEQTTTNTYLQAFYRSPLTDSNRRPPPYHGGALPTELRGRGPDCSPGRGARCDGLRGCLRGRGRLAGWGELARVVAREHLLAGSERVPRDLERPRPERLARRVRSTGCRAHALDAASQVGIV